MNEEIFSNFPWNTNLMLLRVLKGWSQKEAGDMCQTYKKNYWQWEKGQCYPSPKNRKRIAAAFGIDMKYIFSPNDQTVSNTDRNIEKNYKNKRRGK